MLTVPELRRKIYRSELRRIKSARVHTTPNVLSVIFKGESIKTVAKNWEKFRKTRKSFDFCHQTCFGEVPTPSGQLTSFKLFPEDQTIFNGLCTRKEVLNNFLKTNLEKVT